MNPGEPGRLKKRQKGSKIQGVKGKYWQKASQREGMLFGGELKGQGNPYWLQQEMLVVVMQKKKKKGEDVDDD